MITHKDLAACKRKDSETWAEFRDRYNKMVDALNKNREGYQYSKLLLIII